jgi:hypothetical protein
MSAGAGDSDIEKLARALWGEPNRQKSTREDIRYGTNGSKSVRPKERTWYDHEALEGGGYVDLYQKVHGEQPTTDPSIATTYDYQSPDGALLYQVVRKVPKDFRQRRPDGAGGWVWKMGGIVRVPYRLPQLMAADPSTPVFICEGEKDCDALAARGLITTTNPGGAGKWLPNMSSYLRGRDAIILPDNDQAGDDHALDVAAKLHGIARSVTIHRLPGLPPKGDVSDWLAYGGNVDDLSEIVIQTPPPRPAAVEDAPPPEEADPNYLAAIEADISRSPVDIVMAEFNRKYMVINEAGRAVIYAPAYDTVLKRERFDRMTFEDLKRLYLNRRVKVGEDEKSKFVMRGAADIWLTHIGRRQYINGVTFDPSSREQQDGILNLWKGFSTKPKAGDWSLMRVHIRDVLCNRDHERFAYLMGWMARMLQQPDAQGEVAVVLKGGEGAGKGTLAKALLSIIGYHSLAISNSKHLTGNFNAHLRDVVFLFADEAFFAGDKASIGSLKSLITEPYLTVEPKYQNVVQIPNFLHIIMASNEEWVVPAALDARRFFVLDVPDDKKGQYAYFAKIIEQMEAGGYQAMLHDLLEFDLTGFNVRDVPITEGLQQQKKLSLGTADSWWMEVLHRGYVLQSRHGLHHHFGEWQELVSTEVLYTSYAQWADRRHERHPMSREMLGRQMRLLGCKPRRLLNAVVGEETRDVETGYGMTSKRGALIHRHQPPGYSIGTLGSARDAFTNRTQLHVDWEDTIDDDEQA